MTWKPIPRKQLDRATGVVLTWLDSPHPEQVRAQVARWGPDDWHAVRRAINTQGIGPFLHWQLERHDLGDAFPPEFRAWLSEARRLNADRVGRMHAELAGILRACHWAGLEVIPLKGLPLSACYYPSPDLRPLADLDLLVGPRAEAQLALILNELGYEPETPDNFRAEVRHRRFSRPDAREVVSWDGEHPGNPRPVEIHTALDVPLWGDVVAPYLPDLNGMETVQIDLFDTPIPVFSGKDLLAYLSIHTLQHLMIQTGRAIQLVDLACVLPHVHDLSGCADPDWVYPPLRLAQRLLPSSLAGVDLSLLSGQVQPKLREWAERAPISGACGLNLGAPPSYRGKFWLHWERWRPSPWRLALAYGPTPLPLALARHAWSLAGHVFHKGLASLRGQPGPPEASIPVRRLT